jgi:NAD(P)-dependent dehydrogenase (short-subunit alcohol dehydrogenase family)
MFSMNVATARNMCAAVVPKMLAESCGTIVNVGAMSAREGQGNMGAYCVAKSAVMRLTESLSKELREQRINVNAVLPSIIDTPTNRADMPDAEHSKWVDPNDLAEVICFLGSDAARAIHGALVPVVGLS